MPTGLCLLSKHPFLSLLEQVMDCVLARWLCCPEAIFPLLDSIMNHPVPALGDVFHVHIRSQIPSAPDEIVTLCLQDVYHISLRPLFMTLSVEVIVFILSCLLTEKRIIVLSESLEKLSSCIHGLMAVMYPFRWNHMFVPILPEQLLKYVTVPMPFVLGIKSHLRKHLDKYQLHQIVLIDLDNNSIKSSYSNLTRLPQEPTSKLKRELTRLAKKSKDLLLLDSSSAETKENTSITTTPTTTTTMATTMATTMTTTTTTTTTATMIATTTTAATSTALKIKKLKFLDSIHEIAKGWDDLAFFDAFLAFFVVFIGDWHNFFNSHSPTAPIPPFHMTTEETQRKMLADIIQSGHPLAKNMQMQSPASHSASSSMASQIKDKEAEEQTHQKAASISELGSVELNSRSSFSAGVGLKSLGGKIYKAATSTIASKNTTTTMEGNDAMDWIDDDDAGGRNKKERTKKAEMMRFCYDEEAMKYLIAFCQTQLFQTWFTRQQETSTTKFNGVQDRFDYAIQNRLHYGGGASYPTCLKFLRNATLSRENVMTVTINLKSHIDDMATLTSNKELEDFVKNKAKHATHLALAAFDPRVFAALNNILDYRLKDTIGKNYPHGLMALYLLRVFLEKSTDRYVVTATNSFLPLVTELRHYKHQNEQVQSEMRDRADLYDYQYKEEEHLESAKRSNLIDEKMATIDFANLNLDSMNETDQIMLTDLLGLNFMDSFGGANVFSEVSQFDAKNPNLYRVKMAGGEVKMIPPFDHLHQQFRPPPLFATDYNDDDDNDNDNDDDDDDDEEGDKAVAALMGNRPTGPLNRSQNDIGILSRSDQDRESTKHTLRELRADKDFANLFGSPPNKQQNTSVPLTTAKKSNRDSFGLDLFEAAADDSATDPSKTNDPIGDIFGLSDNSVDKQSDKRSKANSQSWAQDFFGGDDIDSQQQSLNPTTHSTEWDQFTTGSNPLSFFLDLRKKKNKQTALLCINI
ncbi:DENN domain-containing protein 1B isoform 1 [Reticulomyxa filosa]|uniref:DENN domain-containing protein 1B isoform 1 n=1 Tax=Reticulomyxa filosa TaxID=46433 RepID=X6M9F5_RETFI|nr:DENN domain-containing protein 1B isoform 1 [Reticulomyxa filosa]|eukprot:ETO09650.1 DENN domain-containing protein 1B isoform 1 [Reticulomyxa filosa]